MKLIELMKSNYSNTFPFLWIELGDPPLIGWLLSLLSFCDFSCHAEKYFLYILVLNTGLQEWNVKLVSKCL